MKRCCAAILCILLAVCAMVPAGAIAVVGYGLNIPSQAAVGKSVTAQIELSCGSGCDLGAMIFTVEYDTGALTYREAKLSAAAPGELRAYDDDGVLKMIYLNSFGTALSTEKKDLISLRFTASASECRTTLTLEGTQAATAQEQRLSYESPTAYDVSVQKKVSENPAPAKARKASAINSKGTSSSSKNRTTAGINGQAGEEDGGYIDPWEQNNAGEFLNSEGGFLSVGENGSNPFENNIFWLVTCGIGLAAVLALLVFGAYRLGQRKKSVSAPVQAKDLECSGEEQEEELFTGKTEQKTQKETILEEKDFHE